MAVHYCLPGNDFYSAMVDGPVPLVGEKVLFRDTRDQNELTESLVLAGPFLVARVSHYVVIKKGHSEGHAYVYLTIPEAS